MPPTPPETEPADVPPIEDQEVVFVKTVVRKLKLHMLDYDDGLRCQWYGKPGPNWDESGYYTSKVANYVEGVSIPSGTPFVVALEEAKEIGGVPVGDYARMTCMDPRDDDKTLSFGYWYGVQKDQSSNFTKVENDMMVLAIAATGLALDQED
jgi:hypothetical protein